MAIKQAGKVGALADSGRYPERVRVRMRVKVLYFGVLRDRFGASDEVVELADGATVGGLLGLLRERTSNSAMESGKVDGALEERLWRSLAVAVNREYAQPSMVLREGDEVALLPPVSGGSFAEGEKLASLGTARTAKGSLRSQMQLRSYAGRERTLC